MSAWEDKRLIDKVAIVTGANTGIGKATAFELAMKGAKVILACRSLERGNAAAEDILRTGDVSANNVIVMKLDLGDFQSVRDFVSEFNARESRLDLLINNAGIVLDKRTITPEGNDLVFQVNHLGHFLLTNLLLDKLKTSAPSRVINVSSDAYKFKEMDLKNLSLEGKWSSIYSYGQSKLANVYFTQELHKRLEGTNVSTYALHPGIIKTELARDFEGKCLLHLFRCLAAACMKKPDHGAKTTLYCATAEDIPSGEYYKDCKRTNLKSIGRKPAVAEELWLMSERLVGLS